MLIGRIRGSNFCYKAVEGMENCQDLHVRVDDYEGQRVMSSAWIPTPDELKRLNEGQPIHLHVWGNGHPPVALSVPED